ncbi:MAG: MFS transporter [Phycisphaerales bacterium]|nr:MFS transporter [Phycisphaerales bacterium]
MLDFSPRMVMIQGVPEPSEPSPNPEMRDRPIRGLTMRVASPVKLVMLAFLSFHPSAMPWLSRPNYAHGLRSAFFLPWAIAATEGSVIGFIVHKLFDGVVDDQLLNYIAAALISAPALANITSFLWASLAHGKRKIPFITALQLGVLISVAVMAMAPRTPAGLAMLVSAAFTARIMLAGIVTVRSTIWGVNYPTDRARLTGEVQAVSVTISSMITIGLGLAMQASENSYRIILPVGGIVALIGVGSYARIRVRGERKIIRSERRSLRKGQGSSIKRIARVLIDDKKYRDYQLCQLLIGFGNIMSWAPFVIIAKDQFGLDYLPGLILTQVTPMLMMPLFIPMWAKLLDRVHVIKFRAIHSWIFILSFAFALFAAQFNIVALMFVAQIIRGIAFGGGALAWNLGHLHFVRADRSSDYMSVHVTLTGLRGLTAPFVGVAIYNLYDNQWPGEGSWVFAVGMGVVLCGALGFAHLARNLNNEQSDLENT